MSKGARLRISYSRFLIPATVAGLLSCLAGCDDKGPLSGGGTENDTSMEAHRIACVDRINAFRETEDLPPYERWQEGEACADAAAKTDAENDDPHSAFSTCQEFAQNECPAWLSVENVLNNCLQDMWDEGPGESFPDHGHYLNMSNETYVQVACGFYITDDGKVWAVQNFR